MPRIVCPSCGARYDVAAAIGPAGKTVRCARCSNVWLAKPEGAPPEPEPLLPQWPEPPPPRVRETPEEPEWPRPREIEAEPMPRRPRPAPLPPVRDHAHDAVDEPAAPPPRRRAGTGAVLAWIATLALLGAAGYGAVTYPAKVIEVWPASARLYTTLGLTP